MNVANAVDSLVRAAERVLTQLEALLPSLLAALGFLFAGWLVGRLLERAVTKLIDRLAPGLESRASRLISARLGIERRLAEVAGRFVFWIVLAVFAVAAVEALGLPVLAAWVSQLGALLPRLFLGGFIVVVGLLAGAVARDATTAAARAGGVERADTLGRAAQVLVVVTAIVTGLDQVGVDSRFLTSMLAIILGGALGGTALAFALGARTEVGNLVAMQYVRRIHRAGQLIRLGTVRGRIRAFTTTTVVLATDSGEAHVPGRMFSDQVAEVPVSEDEVGSR